ncbi:MAG: hypothetical protein IKS78_00220, partial [Clostridia bacterium]|nr:hypothetical protein [Clostridia bacterium]
RPELLETARLTRQDRSLLREIKRQTPALGAYLGGCPEEVRLRIFEEGAGHLAPASKETAACAALFGPEEGGPYRRVFTAFFSEDDSLSLSPLAFDPAVKEISGDEGIGEAILFGGDGFDFACVAARLLPVKEVKDGVVKYGSSRRIRHVPAEKPRLLCRFKDGSETNRPLNRYSNAFVKWLAGFLAGEKSGAEAWAETAKKIYEQTEHGAR